VSARYDDVLDYLSGATLWVDFKTVRGTVVEYTVLLLSTSDGIRAVRLYDATHGYNEMHRYSRRRGKLTGTRFHSASLGEGMRIAIAEIKEGHIEMIEGWRRG
jgi:hypothetical protein